MPEKIVHIITKLQLGGAQQNTLYTLENLKKNRRGVLISGPGGYLDREAVSSEKYSISFCYFLRRKVSPVFDTFAFFWIYFYLLSCRPAVVHTHSSKAGIIGRWAAFFAGVDNIIHTFHGFGFTPLQKPPVRKFFIFLEKITASITDVFIAVAEDNISKAVGEGIGEKSRYRLVRSGIELEKFEKAPKFAIIRDNLGIKYSEKVVGNISCFKPQKGLEVFIDVCAELDKRGDYRYLLVGDGKLRPVIEKMIFDKGLSDKFILTGRVRGVENILPSMDVMVHTAYFEGLPRVVLEAMACKVPVVATAVDGVKDVIKDGVNGFLASPGDRRSLAVAAGRLLNDENLRKRVSQKAKKDLKEEFSIENMSRILNDLYEKRIEEKKK
ncbi:MAG: glycosyltransferase family 4 protein [Elusimicrobiota bacterium]